MKYCSIKVLDPVPVSMAGIFFALLMVTGKLFSQTPVTMIPVAGGWASNSVNTIIFRKNSLVTHKNWQYTAYYNQEGFVVLGKRKQGSTQWQLKTTLYKGNVSDAHNTISLMVDGDGYLHLAWDHHNHPLRYCRSIRPASLELTERMAMTGQAEQRISYPEFYRTSNGNLIFLYRDGQSGQGNLVINHYNRKTKQWSQHHKNLIDGEGKRNAYWQACVDSKGTIHLSWVWRESPDVASNHDLAYACSKDGGTTWERSTGERYQLPITATTAEYACRIPQQSELINQTSMYADEQGRPYIATYWREAGTTVPQYHIVYMDSKKWQVRNLDFRTTPFSLSGQGTKRIPISRPQLIVWNAGRSVAAALVFRDAERQDKVSVATTTNLSKADWQITDLTDSSVGSWEPTYDTEWWKKKKVLQLFIQPVEQVDGEGKANLPPQTISVLEWKPKLQR